MKKQWLRKPVTWVVLIVLMSVTEVFAGPQDHDGGFFLRLSTGLGFAQTKFGDPDFPMEISGLVGDLNIGIGAVILRNLALHGTLFGWSAPDPSVEIDNISGELGESVTLSSIGGGLTYYFMPTNLYFSGSVGIASLSIEEAGETDMGPAFELALGKEWWVGNSWGLGVAGAVGYHSVPEKLVDENWSGLSFAVRFTATLN